MKIRNAEILCVGTELLLGEVINTNAAYISRELAKLGISVYHTSVVGDNPQRLESAVKMAPLDADIYLMCGDIYLSQGRNREAYVAYEKAIELGIPRPELQDKLKASKGK